MTALATVGVVVLALVCTAAVMIGFESVSSALHPDLVASTADDPTTMPSGGIPPSAALLVLAGMFVGSLVGGAVVGRFAPTAPVALAVGIGALLTVGHFVNVTRIAHPPWFAIAGAFAFVPAYVVMARRIGGRRAAS